ncbi:LRRC74A [Bugula neritina]|uniref:LRRC74A n=1 Tax=Bugula neritina TaxID=10212 RepID=A0A7J7J187_BUGNE|nr:LRRC74A [Bugula neritina]
MAEKERSSRTPSQLGLKAAFSRPSSKSSKDSADQERNTSQSRCNTALDREKSTLSGAQGVLITELAYESGGEEERDKHDDAQLVENTSDKQPIEDSSSTSSDAKRKSQVETKINPPDIFNDQEWDTDLEDEEETTDMGPPFRGLYSYACDRYGCNPKSYFMRHIEDKEVKMRHHGFTKSESYALAEVLKSIITVDTLDLEDNWLRNVGCKQLCKMMLDNDNIHEMNLSQNQLGIEAAIQIGRMLKTNHTLQSLSLAANAFEEDKH